jgi:EAL domain-containing protein (putative c-di-GMP-specific phosphodiesterase class I)
VVDLQSGKIVKFEALARWLHPARGTIPPVQFIPIAEETGLIVPLGEQVLRDACAAVKRWTDAGHPDLRVAVNLSPVQFRGQKLVEIVTSILAETGARPPNLGLEITESTLLEAREESIDTLRRLRALGIRVSVDDFGTGYSSLAYLKNFPVDTLKIDRSFVRDLAWSADDAAITRAIIALGQSLKLRIVAEGVETQEQFGLLRDEGCDEVQGYLVGKPQNEEAFFASLLSGIAL